MMFRQLVCFLVICVFLFAKGNLSFADQATFKTETSSKAASGADDPADDEKESKNMEFADEILPHSTAELTPQILSRKLIHTAVYAISVIHFPVWGPPPNCALSHNA